MLGLTSAPKIMVLLGRRSDDGEIMYVHLPIARSDNEAKGAGVDLLDLYYDPELLKLRIRSK